MAIKDISRKPFIQDNDTNVKVGIDLPIRRDDVKGGFFASTSTTIEAVKNNIRNLLQTNEGERFFQPNLGLNLRTLLLFETNFKTPDFVKFSTITEPLLIFPEKQNGAPSPKS